MRILHLGTDDGRATPRVRLPQPTGPLPTTAAAAVSARAVVVSRLRER